MRYFNSPLLGIVLIAIVSACATEGADLHPSDPDAGILVIIGGGLDAENEAVYRTILDGRDGEGPLCVIPTAGANPASSMESAVERIERWGGEGSARGILLTVEHPQRANEESVAEEFGACSGFFFTGGVQSRILNVFLAGGEPTRAYEALMQRFREGAVVAGTSAGAAMMSNPMISGGSSEEAFAEGVIWEGYEDGVRLERGMGFLENLPVDQHFLARGRIGRLLTVVLQEEDVSFGIGVDENTALVVDGRRGRVVGASGVIWVDGTRAQPYANASLPAVGSGLRIELLGDDDEIDLRTGEVRVAEGKKNLTDGGLALSEVDARMEDDAGLFDRWVLLYLLHAMAVEHGAERTLNVDNHRVHLRAGEDFRGVAWPEEGIRETPHGLSVGPVEIEIEAVR